MRTPVTILTHEPHMAVGAIESLSMLDGHGTVHVIDDSGDSEWRAELASMVDEVVAVGDEPQQGYWTAMRTVWATARRHAWPRWFHLEQDFRFVERVNLADLHALLDAHPRLTQVALQRQAGAGLDHHPWYETERRCGGVIAAMQRHWPALVTVHDGWVEQSRVLTTNPALIDARALTIDWPDQAGSERAYSDIAAAKGHRFAYWGAPGHVTVEHVGQHTGVGY